MLAAICPPSHTEGSWRRCEANLSAADVESVCALTTIRMIESKGNGVDQTMNRLNRTLMMSLMAVSLVCAQGPRGGPGGGGDPVDGKVSRLTQALSLTTSRQQRAKTIFTNAETARQSLRESSSTARESLTAAIKSNNFSGIDRAAAALGNIGAQSTSIEAKAEAAFYQILTADQQAKYTPMVGGPGGRMGGGPGPQGFRGRPSRQ